MNPKGLLYFLIPSLIWGSTWYIIKFQIGPTDPMFSVAFRFLIAGVLILIFCLVSGRSLRFPLKTHLFIGLQGICLFGFNYWFVYMAEIHLTSALVAVVFSTLIFMNIFLNRLIMKAPIEKRVVLAAILGFSGVILLFKKELEFSFSDESILAVFFCLASVILASTGNVLSALNQRNKIPLIQTNAVGMLYGAMALLIVALVKGTPLILDTNLSYYTSLLYLSLLGSVIAFSLYLKMLGEIGPDKAGYVILVVPLVALTISTLFENYQWDAYAIGGTILLLLGNTITLIKVRKLKEAAVKI